MASIQAQKLASMRRSVSFRIYTSAFTFIAVLVVAAGFAVFMYETQSVHRSLNTETEEIKERVSAVIIEPLWSFSKNQIDTILSLEMRKQEILYIYIWDERGALFSGLARKPDDTVVAAGAADRDFIKRSTYRTIFSELKREGYELGVLEIGVTDFFAAREIQRRFVTDILRTVAVSAIGLAFVLHALKTGVLDPLSRLDEAVNRFGNRDFAARVPVPPRDDEMADLSRTFNTMADLIQGYSGDLERLVAERTQQLVEAEKMAFLGSLVAGVAHEINTPVGVAVTAASHLQERGAEVEKEFRERSLTRSALEAFLAESAEASGILLTNLRRTSDFVRSFKQVAVDQTNEERRIFKVKPYLEEIVFSLRPKLKKTRHVVEVDAPEGLTLNSMPGMFAQIVTNLIINSLTHGFDEGAAGRIDIQARVQGGKFALHYRDNGKGIPRENLQKIFQPFFTTRRSHGGTGLGLYIVSNIVTNLSGSISCTSEPGQGVEFIVTLPAEAIADPGAGR
ncbi:MAG: HAMP domain-containing sensor histidine kinase [Spirochaetes bacterium]|nr:HAMP domain-containing sensor histidine kinase [Spirochaetota bacterium]